MGPARDGRSVMGVGWRESYRYLSPWFRGEIRCWRKVLHYKQLRVALIVAGSIGAIGAVRAMGALGIGSVEVEAVNDVLAYR